jgi:DNA-binding protein H-NS
MAKRPNYDRMDFAALRDLRNEVDKALNQRISHERRSLESRMAELSALEGGAPRRGRKPGSGRAAHPLKGTKAAAKYRGPGGETWAGRGLAPRWLTALEKKGKKRDQFLVDKS